MVKEFYIMGEFDLFSKIKSLFGAQDMTVGSPTASIIKFAIPLLIGNFAQQLYNTVDAIIVGQNVGDSALAAVGASNPIINLLLALFMGISTGAGIIVSQYFGAKQRENLSKTVGNVIFLTLVPENKKIKKVPSITDSFIDGHFYF